jgi:hypothetical protein
MAHFLCPPVFMINSTQANKSKTFLQSNEKTRPGSGARKKLKSSLIFRLTAGFGTLHALQVAGLHRAVPSATLDKVFNCSLSIADFCPLSRPIA